MGTRADFYVGRGEQAEWLGSIAYDGYSIAESILNAKTEEEYREAVTAFLKGRMVRDPNAPSHEDAVKAMGHPEGMPGFTFDPYEPPMDATFVEDGWPWPWENSNTTDYAYAFDGGEVFMNIFGHGWHTKAEDDEFQKIYQAWEEADDESDEPDPPWETGSDKSVFPNMKDKQNVTLGPRSGVMVLTIGK